MFENQRRAEARLLVIPRIADGGDDAALSHRGSQILPSSGPDSGCGAAGDSGRPNLIALDRSEPQCRERRRLHRPLLGVAVQNGIIMVSNLNRMRKSGFELHEAIMKGATERLRPVPMTATVATFRDASRRHSYGSRQRRAAAALRPWWSAGWRFPPYSPCSFCPRCTMSSSIGPSNVTAKPDGVDDVRSHCIHGSHRRPVGQPGGRACRRAPWGRISSARRRRPPPATAARRRRVPLRRPRRRAAARSTSSRAWIFRASGGLCFSRPSSITSGRTSAQGQSGRGCSPGGIETGA